ncbi:MAG: glycine--tRNA ligase subunit beta [Deltaproteobacteria bacterium]|nr:glycine--tRNA ligase subunit beta [Deltaproteobacteria bacterium]
MSDELLLEIGTEEIPAAFMPDALAALQQLMENELAARRIGVSAVETFGTPRRLVLAATGLAAAQTDLSVEKMGPAKSIAFDADGNPTKAALGFAKGQGIDISQVTIVSTDKGEYICAKKHETGAATGSLLPDILSKVISQLPFPKSMRWKDMDVRFARPIHWIVALFGGAVVPFTYGNVTSGDTTRGHRFMAPGPVKVSGIASYRAAMDKSCVVIDQQERKAMIAAKLNELAAQAGGTADIDEKLLQEVMFLIEAPYPVLCSFEKEYLELPKEVLVTTMKKHQKYFPVLDAQGKPLNHFIAVNNTAVKDPSVVINGHERVLRARLSDARFFYAEDQKKSLPTLTESLKNVLYQKQLGTSFEKMERFRALAVHIASVFNPGLKDSVERAAYLCKADLVSEMVGEFPELQGIMGREYARLAAEPEAVYQAIFEHYLPRFAGDELPAGDTGAIVSIADKLDTIAGCFSIGLVPTGTADPYALRRQCLGIINIIVNKNYNLSLSDLVETAAGLLEGKSTRPMDEVCADVLSFFSGRLSNMLTSQGFSYDVVDAVLALGIDNIPDSASRIEALQQMKKDPDFEALSIAFKRVVNILKAGTPEAVVETGLFEHDAERALFDKYLEIRDTVITLMKQRRYVDALKLVATIRAAVDGFFDSVLVMADDAGVRQNRCALLGAIASLFTGFADFSKIAAE